MEKRFITAMMMLLLGIVTSMAQSAIVKGKVIDKTANGPLAFASVALIQSDSVIMASAMTDTDGCFQISAPTDNYMLKASFIGYKDATVDVKLTGNDSDTYILYMEEDARMLQEVVVKSQLPKTTLKGDAVVTTITGSVLEHSGNANDVLAKVPGMINRNGNLEVLGRGTPIYNINGHKVTDDAELRNLMSEDIKSVDVVSNPGALYGGNVRCVVRIKTLKRQGEGFSYALTSQARKYTTCRYFDPSWTVLDLNYRTGGWDFFGKFVYWAQHSFQISDIYGGTFLMQNGQQVSKIQDGTLKAQVYRGGIDPSFGANWQINNNHSLGFKIEYATNTFDDQKVIMDNDFVVNGVVEDHVFSVSKTKTPISEQWTGNAYYDGTVGKLNINFNADFMRAKIRNEVNVNESSWTTPADLYSHSEADAQMYAGKLVLTYPVWKGSLQVGSEESYYDGTQQYAINKSDIPAADGKNKENTIAGFAQYAVSLPFGQFTAGLRYEHVDFEYHDYEDATNNLTRKLDDWFPSISFATKVGKVSVSLSYTGKTQNPSLHALSNEISYDNRYTYQSGDPKLLSEKQRTASLSATWKWLTFNSNYETVKNGITQWATPYNDDGVVMIRYKNINETYHKFSMYLNASPKIGVWNPRYTIGYSKPQLKMHVIDQREATGERIVERNNPMYFLQTNNAFILKNNWQLEVNYQYTSKMSDEIMNKVKPTQSLDLSVQKSFLKDNALTFNLSWVDVFNSNIYHFETDFGSYIINQSADSRTPGVVLRVSYRFNSAQSKYKGTGAGQSVKSRM
ncbi:MAG: outer membrane beta-barrel family protein [Prevotellaceae bacterium]|nr:outer membrane beta-barrel family protein [Prevotellaceae bacterium]